jgi:hypothetical protein
MRAAYLILMALLLVSVTVTYAQDTCPALVRRALTALDANCASMDRNTACYGYNRVSARFTQEVADDYFAAPSDRAALAEISTLQTAAMDVENDQWGVAIMSIQASLPDVMPGQGVLFVLIGDTEVQNAVSQEAAFTPAAPVEVRTSTDANIRSGAGREFNPLGAVARNTALQADGVKEDGTWVRVVYRDRPAWVSITVLQPNDAIASLPVWDSSLRSPMQAFYVKTGIGDAGCAEAPQDTLMVQGPRNVKVDLTVNGAEVRIGSTVLFRTPDDGTLEIIVLDGEAFLPGAGENGQDVLVLPGFSTRACLEDAPNAGDGSVSEVACPFSEPERVPINELTDDWCSLQEVPSGLLHYPVDLPCPGDPETQGSQPPGGGGRQPRGTCANFRILSPTTNASFSDTFYSWTGVEGADEYVINWQYPDGTFMNALYVGNVTSVSYFSGSLPLGEFRWLVLALKNQQILCSTPASGVVYTQSNPSPPPQDVAQPEGPAAAPQFAVWLSCNGGYVQANWANLSVVGETGIFFSGAVSGSYSGNSGSAVGTLTNGTVNYVTLPYYSQAGVVGSIVC